MRILADTNILFSAILFPGSKPAKVLLHIVNNHELVLCRQNIRELMKIIEHKAPQHFDNARMFLSELEYILIPDAERSIAIIRDRSDQPILNGAVAAHVDIIVTGDKDFLILEMEYPKCISAAQFLKDEGIE